MRARINTKGLLNFKSPYKLRKREKAFSLKVEKPKTVKQVRQDIPLEKSVEKLLGEQATYEHTWHTFRDDTYEQ